MGQISDHRKGEVMQSGGSGCVREHGPGHAGVISGTGMTRFDLVVRGGLTVAAGSAAVSDIA